MDFSIFPGWTGYVFWRLGLVGLWHRRFNPHFTRPERRRPAARPVLTVVPPKPIVPAEDLPAPSAVGDESAR
jgi:hypothetical protein